MDGPWVVLELTTLLEDHFVVVESLELDNDLVIGWGKDKDVDDGLVVEVDVTWSSDWLDEREVDDCLVVWAGTEDDVGLVGVALSCTH